MLLLSLAGPLQSWGDSSRFTVRQTRQEPTKSGVIGLVASALGRERGSALEDLCALEFGVRVDQPGTVIRDFQTERSMDGRKTMPLSNRYYLADAKFLVALGGPEELVGQIESAVISPAWPLYLGRRSCPPDGPLVRNAIGGPYENVREALAAEPWLAAEWYRKRLAVRGDAFPELEVLCDALDGESYEIRSDLPLSFGEVRRYGQRRVARYLVPNPNASGNAAPEPSAPSVALGEHDPMAFL